MASNNTAEPEPELEPEPDRSLPARLRLVAVVTCAVAAAVPALWQLWTLVTVFSNRCLYPADLEWMEGAQLVHAHRLLQGEPLYTACQSDMFIPFPYPPLHSVVLAGLGKIFGLGFGVGRGLSIGSLVVCGAVLVREISGAAVKAGERPRGLRRLTLRWLAPLFLGLLAIAAIAAGYPVVDSWYDLIRVDTMFLALVLTAAALAADPEPPAPRAAASRDPGARRPPWRLARLLATAALLTAAFFTKQTAACFLPWIIL